MADPIAALWQRLDTPGHDACQYVQGGDGWILHGTAVFVEDGGACQLRYEVVADAGFRTREAMVTGWIGAMPVDLRVRYEYEAPAVGYSGLLEFTRDGVVADYPGLVASSSPCRRYHSSSDSVGKPSTCTSAGPSGARTQVDRAAAASGGLAADRAEAMHERRGRVRFAACTGTSARGRGRHCRGQDGCRPGSVIGVKALFTPLRGLSRLVDSILPRLLAPPIGALQMNSLMTRVPLAIALFSAVAFAVGCDNRSVDDRTDMQTAAERDAQTMPPAGTAPVVQDRTMAERDRIGDGPDSDQPIDDTWITTKVKSSLLADSDVAGLDIEVETVNGVVTLTGQVDQQMQIDRATRIARDIEGVTDVRTAGLSTANR